MKRNNIFQTRKNDEKVHRIKWTVLWLEEPDLHGELWLLGREGSVKIVETEGTDMSEILMS